MFQAAAILLGVFSLVACASSSRGKSPAGASEEPANGALHVASTDDDNVDQAVVRDYVASISGAIMGRWKGGKMWAPHGEQRSVIVRVRVLRDGVLTDVVIIKSSEDAAFDRSCLEAIHQTGKVVPPPAELRPMFDRGVPITFAP